MEPYWDSEPTFWDRIVAFGFGSWVLVTIAGITAMFVARHILIPDSAAYRTSRAQRLARIRTVSGFSFVATSSVGYRSIDDTFDNAVWTFEKSVPVALAVFAVLVSAFWLTSGADIKRQVASELPVIGCRIGKFVAALGGTWLFAYVSGIADLGDNPYKSHGEAVLFLMVGAVVLGLFGMGLWCISCYWFGIGDAHPLIPPFGAAATVLIVAQIELHFSGPGPLPLRLWLLITLSAVVTTLGVCFVEICDVQAEPYRVERRWPVATAWILATTMVTSIALFLLAGGAERTFCAAGSLINCGTQ